MLRPSHNHETLRVHDDDDNDDDEDDDDYDICNYLDDDLLSFSHT